MTDPGAREEPDSLMKMNADVRTSFTTMGEAFTGLCDEVRAVKHRVGKVEDGLEKVEHRLARVEEGLANQTRRISNLDRSMHDGFTGLNDRMARFEQRLSAFLEAQARMLQRSTGKGRPDSTRRARRRRS